MTGIPNGFRTESAPTLFAPIDVRNATPQNDKKSIFQDQVINLTVGARPPGDWTWR